MVHIEKGKVAIVGNIEDVMTDIAFGLSKVLQITTNEVDKEFAEIIFTSIIEVTAEDTGIDLNSIMERKNNAEAKEAMTQAMEMIKKGEKNNG